MKHRILILCCLLAGCVTNPPPASRASMEARQALFVCHAEQAAALDDRQSDASTIGRAVHRACMAEAMAAIRTSMSPYQPMSYQEAYEAEFMRGSSAHATQAVLEARVSRSR